MTFHLCTEVRTICDKSFGNLVFLFNPRQGSWVAITSQAYEYLERYLESSGNQEDDPLSLGLRMGFSQEEIEQFFTYLTERGILTTAQQSVEKDTYTLGCCYLHVTQMCNLECRTCYSWREDRNTNQEELSLEQIEQVLAQLASLQLQTLAISGGEPLIRKDLPEILRLAKEKYYIPRIVLITNGTLVSYEQAIAIEPWVDEVAVSLDGPTEEVNSKIRGKGNFDRTLKGIHIFKASSTKPISIIATLTHANLRHLQEFKDLAQNIGVGISFSMFVGLGAGRLPEAQALTLTTQDLHYLAQAIMEMGDIKIDLDGISPRQQNEAPQKPLYLALGARSGCSAGRKMLAVDCDGSIYPCQMLMKPELCMGNVSQKPLTDILGKSPLSRFFQHLHVDQIETCKDCTLRYFCGGGCRANAYSTSNNLQAHDPACPLYCTYTHAALGPLLENPVLEK